MPKLRVLGSDAVIKILREFGFDIAGQKGSHIKLTRQTSFQKQMLTIPKANSLPKGTLKAIFAQASRFVSQEELHEHFYTK